MDGLFVDIVQGWELRNPAFETSPPTHGVGGEAWGKEAIVETKT